MKAILCTITKNLTKNTQMVSWKYKLGTWTKGNTHKQETYDIDQLKMNNHHLMYASDSIELYMKSTYTKN